MSTDFQVHHLIPNELQGHAVLDALRNSSIGYDQDADGRSLLILPQKGSAAQVMEIAQAADPDAVHIGSHAAYSQMIDEIPDDIGEEFLDGNGNFRAGITALDLDSEINKLQFFLLTVSPRRLTVSGRKGQSLY
ncbi:AHH domain-containing protein [Breoghania sp. L-A4]|uniref:AHH domain-containing protein n=1 Tax=Breoghania sp. L-A4 TaxID=2304600 RepID=UPI000E359209|nr:AHH domain-containing protein [Breoghania sp. L-A4]AXS39484.1 hypothetical protein D1F64_04745 [Breoghania sp. L-A4]